MERRLYRDPLPSAAQSKGGPVPVKRRALVDGTTRRRIAALGGGIALLGVVLSAIPAVLDVEETLGLGWLFAARGPIEPPPEVVIVSLSRATADEFGISRDVDEWPRARHADLVERLQAGAAAVSVFDIMFHEPRLDNPEGDLRLARAIAEAGNVILAERAEEDLQTDAIGEVRHPPIEPLSSAALATAPFMLPLVPVRVNQAWVFGRGAGTPSLPSVALHAFAAGAHEPLLSAVSRVRPALEPLAGSFGLGAARELGLQEVIRRLRRLFQMDPALAGDVRDALAPEQRSDPLLLALLDLYAGNDSRYLNFYGPPRTIETIPYHEVLRADPAALHDMFAGRAVFIGFSETRRDAQQDEFVSVYTDRSGHRLAGVEIGATMFANLLRRESIRPLPLLLHWTVVAIFGVVVAAVSLLLRGFTALAVTFSIGALFAAGTHIAFQSLGVWGPLAVPLGVQLPAALLIALSWNYSILRKQRERIRTVLGLYVPPEVVARLAEESLRPLASRELVFGTCLVTDVEKYTTLSESLHPSDLGLLMDDYYDAIVSAVHRHGGVVSDIGGDSMIAVWPTASSIEETRLGASRGALEIMAAVEAFNRERIGGELPTRIGIHSGELLLGNVGAKVRVEYRAIGDIVNTASRLQGLNRLLGTRVLVSSAAAEMDGGFPYRPLGEFLLVGKRTPVSVLELRDPARAADPGAEALDAAFVRALERFRAGDFAAAEAAFAAILEQFPHDRASRFFARQCRLYADRPPDGGWDGVVRVTEK